MTLQIGASASAFDTGKSGVLAADYGAFNSGVFTSGVFPFGVFTSGVFPFGVFTSGVMRCDVWCKEISGMMQWVVSCDVVSVSRSDEI